MCGKVVGNGMTEVQGDAMYDISLLGSTVQSGWTLEDAHAKAVAVSEGFAGRLIRVHDVDGETVIAEYRDGRVLAQA